MQLIDGLIKLNELRNEGHGKEILLASEKLEDSITFYKIINFKYNNELNLCNMVLKFAFNTISQPQWLLDIKEYGENTLTISNAYDILKNMEMNGHGNIPIGQENTFLKIYNPVEGIFYEEKLRICSFNLTVNLVKEEDLLSFL